MSEASAFSMYKKQRVQQKIKFKKPKLKKPNPLNLKKLNGTEKIVKRKKEPEVSKKKRFNTEKKQSHNVEVSPEGSRPLEVFQWILAPVTVPNFFNTFWEKSPLCVKRNRKDYYNEILSTEKLDRILRENSLFYTRNVDVVSYIDGKRETHNTEGRAVPAALWDYYGSGCSIRILNPQTYCGKLHALLANLQEYFGCMAGVNAYLTPPNSQGFAPHYDDIEAFVLQLEGRKHWKLYAPLSQSEILPRFSSQNLNHSELGQPIKEITLEAGDMLYFPRGVIHEGRTDDAHSLHITVSVYQKTAYVDLLEHILKPALEAAAQDDIEFRQGLPLHYLRHIGTANTSNRSPVRTEIVTKVETLLAKLKGYVSIDAAADQLGGQFMWDAMPPVVTKDEKKCMVHVDGDKMVNGQVVNKVQIALDVRVRLLRYHCLHLLKTAEADGGYRIYYCTDNARYYHGEERQFFDIDAAIAPAVTFLLGNYPRFVDVKSLPLAKDEDKMQIVADLWENGLLVTEQPLE